MVVFHEASNAEEAVQLANNTVYSLNAALFTRSPANKSLTLASQLNAGLVVLNGPTIHVESMGSLMGLGGETGYGRFDVDGFTLKFTIVVCPEEPGRKYPLVG